MKDRRELVFSTGLIIGTSIVAIMFALQGCDKKPVGKPTVAPIPPAVESFTVPIDDASTKPDVLCLTAGQTAMLLEPVEAKARVPYDSGELYEGVVRFEVGSMVVKPRQE